MRFRARKTGVALVMPRLWTTRKLTRSFHAGSISKPQAKPDLAVYQTIGIKPDFLISLSRVMSRIPSTNAVAPIKRS